MIKLAAASAFVYFGEATFSRILARPLAGGCVRRSLGAKIAPRGFRLYEIRDLSACGYHALIYRDTWRSILVEYVKQPTEPEPGFDHRGACFPRIGFRGLRHYGTVLIFYIMRCSGQICHAWVRDDAGHARWCAFRR